MTSNSKRPKQTSRRHHQWALIAVAAAWLFAACLSTAQVQEGFVVRTILVDGAARNYLLYTPHGVAPPYGRPMVMLLHGGGGSARQIAKHVGGGFVALAEREGFYVVAPDAIDGMWDLGAGRISNSLQRRADDYAFFAALLDSLPAELPINRRRIFATGISRGGQASYFIACSFPGRIRAIAPVAMPLPTYMEALCAAGLPVGLAIFNGTTDPLVPYGGGWITIGRDRRDEVISTDATAALWRRRNGCDQTSPVVERIDRIASDGMLVERLAWRDCSSAILLHRITGGGHTWPASNANLPERLVGRINHDIDATAEIWSFFRQFE